MLGRVATIGYGNSAPEELIERLKVEQITYLIDVRSSPYSKFQPGFSKEALKALLKKNKITYVFMGNEIGGLPKDEDCYTNGKVDYKKCRTKEFFKSGIARVQDAFEQGLAVCLMCSESKPAECHRSKLIGEVLSELGVPVIHFLPNGGSLTQDEVIKQITGGQGNLFGEDFTSRKSYR